MTRDLPHVLRQPQFDLPEPLRLPFEIEPIRTERLLLRPCTPADLDDVWSYQRQAAVTHYWGPAQSREQSEGYIADLMERTRLAVEGEYCWYVVEASPEPGQPMRVVGEVPVLLKSAKYACLDMGWIFHPDVQGRGFATEAARRVLQVCFTRIGAHRVTASLDARNHASARVAERLGMQHEGVQRDVHYSDSAGEWVSSSTYSILAHEYAAGVGRPDAISAAQSTEPTRRTKEA